MTGVILQGSVFYLLVSGATLFDKLIKNDSEWWFSVHVEPLNGTHLWSIGRTPPVSWKMRTFEIRRFLSVSSSRKTCSNTFEIISQTWRCTSTCLLMTATHSEQPQIPFPSRSTSTQTTAGEVSVSANLEAVKSVLKRDKPRTGAKGLFSLFLFPLEWNKALSTGEECLNLACDVTGWRFLSLL